MSDEMVALLKSGRINNRLLCELATHKDFIKFLADIEIYVDGIATMQSRDEKLVVLYCKQLGINYKNLSDEEFRWLIRILKKSKKMGTPISQRKKR